MALLRLSYVVLPPLEAVIVNRRLVRELGKPPNEQLVLDMRYQDWFALGANQLDATLKDENARASMLEEKSSKLSVILGLGLAIAGTVGKSLLDATQMSEVKEATFCFLLIAILYLVWAGWQAFRAGMASRPRMAIGPDWALYAKASPKTARVLALIFLEKSNLVRNNELSVTLDCIRNGVIVFAIAVAISLFSSMLGSFHRANSHSHVLKPAIPTYLHPPECPANLTNFPWHDCA